MHVHNLKGFDLDIPLGKLVVITGVSGSGKSSLAFDTLYAEGQRRYIESFPAYARQYLPKFAKPAVDRIENIPPAIAIGQDKSVASSRATLAGAVGLLEYLRLLFARSARTVCPDCEIDVTRASPESVAEEIGTLAPETPITVAFPVFLGAETDMDEFAQGLREQGFLRVEVEGEIHRISNELIPRPKEGSPVRVLIDRLTAGRATEARFIEALESAFERGEGSVHSRVGEEWRTYTDRLVCDRCGRAFPAPEPALFHWSNPQAACADCRGSGARPEYDPRKVFPDPRRTVRQKGVAPLATPGHKAEFERLLELAPTLDLPIDLPIERFDDEQRDRLWSGAPDAGFDGILGFFGRVERSRHKATTRIFLNRFRRYVPCETCRGKRLTPEVLAHRFAGMDFAELLCLDVESASKFFAEPKIDDQAARPALEQIRRRLEYLGRVGLGYLTLDRPAKTLSIGEAKRAAMTAVFGAGLARTLYVLDEPTTGLHPRDIDRIIDALRDLRDAGNTVVVVEHSIEVLQAADHVIDLGPGAGSQGGRLVYAGPPDGLAEIEDSVTAEFLDPTASIRRVARKPRGFLRLEGACQRHLRRLDVSFPLGCLCVVAGVSGAGKSTLVIDTLYPAVARALGDESASPGPFATLRGADRLDEVALVDGSLVGRSTRSNPATYIKIFDEIRRLFAETLEARTNGLTASDFSFNVAGGRCEQCEGTGLRTIDMQFLPEVRIDCPECAGARYGERILQVKRGGRNIAEVLDLTVRQAFRFFRNETTIQARLDRLKQVGLGYVRLGQSVATLSGGERQRLKLASYLASRQSRRGLLVFEEPTSGLHPADIETLLACFDELIDAGHSLVVVEHDPWILRRADHILELGPGAGAEGGRLIAQGTPAEVADLSTATAGLLRACGAD